MNKYHISYFIDQENNLCKGVNVFAKTYQDALRKFQAKHKDRIIIYIMQDFDYTESIS